MIKIWILYNHRTTLFFRFELLGFLTDHFLYKFVLRCFCFCKKLKPTRVASCTSPTRLLYYSFCHIWTDDTSRFFLIFGLKMFYLLIKKSNKESVFTIKSISTRSSKLDPMLICFDEKKIAQKLPWYLYCSCRSA